MTAPHLSIRASLRHTSRSCLVVESHRPGERDEFHIKPLGGLSAEPRSKFPPRRDAPPATASPTSTCPKRTPDSASADVPSRGTAQDVSRTHRSAQRSASPTSSRSFSRNEGGVRSVNNFPVGIPPQGIRLGQPTDGRTGWRGRGGEGGPTPPRPWSDTQAGSFARSRRPGCCEFPTGQLRRQWGVGRHVTEG